MNSKKRALATAAAALFATGFAGTAQADHHEAGEAKVKCVGVNSCKGHSACQTPHNACSGQNSCKGKGWVYMTDAECDSAKKAMADEKA
jgi:uncharacterized membrane protein